MSRIDLGHDHFGQWIGWSPDRSIPANEERFRGIPDNPHALFTVEHPDGKGGRCESAARIKREKDGKGWDLVSLDPLTLSPSLLCMRCGDHGFIRDGKWVPA